MNTKRRAGFGLVEYTVKTRVRSNRIITANIPEETAQDDDLTLQTQEKRMFLLVH